MLSVLGNEVSLHLLQILNGRFRGSNQNQKSWIVRDISQQKANKKIVSLQNVLWEHITVMFLSDVLVYHKH